MYPNPVPSGKHATHLASQRQSRATDTQSSHWQPRPSAANSALGSASALPQFARPQTQINLAQPKARNIVNQPQSRQQSRPCENAATDLLPYCTTEPPLRQEQVIALSDAAGSLKELVLVALSAAAGDTPSGEKLVSAVGNRSASKIAEFFIDEWEIE